MTKEKRICDKRSDSPRAVYLACYTNYLAPALALKATSTAARTMSICDPRYIVVVCESLELSTYLLKLSGAVSACGLPKSRQAAVGYHFIERSDLLDSSWHLSGTCSCVPKP